MTSGNTTVGLYGTGAKPMVFYTDSTERMRIDSSGNVIINVNAGASDAGTIRITGGTSGLSNLQFADTADGNIGMLQYDHTSNYMLFQVNNSEAMRIDSSGNLLVGTTDSLIWNEAATDNSKEGVVIEPRSLQISRYQDTQALFNRQGNYGRHILFASDGAETGSIQSQANELTGLSNGTLNFAGGNTSGGSKIQAWNDAGNANGYLAIEGYSSEYMRIDSSGNLLVGKTGANSNLTGVQAISDGRLFATTSGSYALVGNRLSSDGDIALFQRDGATVGSIGAVGGSIYIASPQGTDAGLQFGNSIVGPSTTTGANRDNAIDLGWSSNRFKDLYLSGGVVFGDAGGSGTSTSNTLDSYEEGTFTPTAFGNATAGTTTYGSQTGSYTKVGDTVHVDIYISWTAMTGTGDLRIGGLPFTSSSASNYFATGTIVPLLGFTWPSGATQLNPIISASDTAMSIFGSATDSNSDGAATDNEIVALAITITYKV